MRSILEANVGDTVRVDFNHIEEGVERRQPFEGILIKVRGTGNSQTLTVRRMSFGIGVERIFPAASPNFLGLKVIQRGRVRRSKLYYLRELSGKAHRVTAAETSAQAKARVAAAGKTEPAVKAAA